MLLMWVTSDKIKDGSISTTKILNEAITLDKIKKDSINYDHLNANIMDNISKNIIWKILMFL